MSIPFPDTVIFDPVQGSFANAGETFTGGRLMNYCPHIDGLLYISAGDVFTDSANLALTRTAAGDWRLGRTAAGVETYHVASSLGSATIIRTGENYNHGNFNEGTISAGPKGIQVLDIFAVMNIGVVSLTSATLALTQTAYPLIGGAAAAPVITNVVAATAITPLTTTGAGLFLTYDVAVATPVFSILDMSLIDVELTIVMANTGTVSIAGIGAHVAFNYN